MKQGWGWWQSPHTLVARAKENHWLNHGGYFLGYIYSLLNNCKLFTNAESQTSGLFPNPDVLSSLGEHTDPALLYDQNFRHMPCKVWVISSYFMFSNASLPWEYHMSSGTRWHCYCHFCHVDDRTVTVFNINGPQCQKTSLQICSPNEDSSQRAVRSDHSLRCPHEETLHPWLFKMRPVEILISEGTMYSETCIR